MPNKRKYTDEKLREVLKDSVSINSMLTKLGLRKFAGNWSSVKARITKLNLDTSHLLGKKHLKGKSNLFSPKQSLSSILIEYSTYTSSHHLKNRLIKEKILENKCSICDLTEWQGRKIILHLDHRNGIKTDNRLFNLRLLCPNCHSQTVTYCGRNAKF